MVPFLAISSLGPDSALWEKGEKIGVGEKKKKTASEWQKGCAALSPSPGYCSAQLASLGIADIFSIWPRVLAFSPTAEPGPRLSYLQIRWPQLYQVLVHSSIRWFQIVATSQLHKCSCSGGGRGLWTATSWRKTDNKWCVRNFFWINSSFCETAHLPLPLANILHQVRSKCLCSLRGGVGGQFPGNLNWSLLVFW